MKEIDWSNFDPDSRVASGGNGVTFLRFEGGKDYRVRPLGKGVEFYKLFIAKGKPSIIVDPDDKEKAARLLSEKGGREIRPNYRNAMFVIDRADGRVKLLEGGYTIFEPIIAWSKANKIKPGAGQAGDWQISAKGEGMNRKYTTVYLGASLFTEDEKKMIAELKANDKLKFKNYLKETSLDHVVDVAFGSGEAAQQEAPVAASIDDDETW